MVVLFPTGTQQDMVVLFRNGGSTYYESDDTATTVPNYPKLRRRTYLSHQKELCHQILFFHPFDFLCCRSMKSIIKRGFPSLQHHAINIIAIIDFRYDLHLSWWKRSAVGKIKTLHISATLHTFPFITRLHHHATIFCFLPHLCFRGSSLGDFDIPHIHCRIFLSQSWACREISKCSLCKQQR
jgi:hypothetical protein